MTEAGMVLVESQLLRSFTIRRPAGRPAYEHARAQKIGVPKSAPWLLPHARSIGLYHCDNGNEGTDRSKARQGVRAPGELKIHHDHVRADMRQMRLHVINLARENGLVSMNGKSIGDSITGSRILMHHDRPLACNGTVVCSESAAVHQEISRVSLKRCNRSSIKGPHHATSWSKAVSIPRSRVRTAGHKGPATPVRP
jgi:hypothetical protein